MHGARLEHEGKVYWVGVLDGMWFKYQQGTHSIDALTDSVELSKFFNGLEYQVIGVIGVGSYDEYTPFLDYVTFEKYCKALKHDLDTEGSYSTL